MQAVKSSSRQSNRDNKEEAFYHYVAYNEGGEIVRGKLSAADEEAAADLLSYTGYRVVSLKKFTPFFSSDRLWSGSFRVKPNELILFYRQLALLLESGVSITASLRLLQSQASSRALKKVLGEVISDLGRGHQFSAALNKYPQIFPPVHCKPLSIGEQTGSLETMLRQMADYMENEGNTAKGVKGALIYPAITFAVAVVVVMLEIFVVLPVFSNLYSSLGAQLPTLTRVVIGASLKLRENIAYIVLVLAIITAVTLVYVRTPGGRFRLDKLTLSLPVVGRVIHLNELARCCWNISILFHAGLPLTEIMPLIIQTSSNRVMVRMLADVQQDMLKGEGLSGPMAKHKFFLPMMVQMISVGEETGNLDTALSAVAKSYATEADDRTRSLVALIQPVMTLVIALVVGVIALSLVSAMYSIYGQAF